MAHATGSCPCGAATLDIVGPPLFRLFCHCTICQRFNSAPFADVVVYDAADVELPAPGTVNFETYKPPPNVQRGTCASCDEPAVEVFSMPLFPKLVMVPSAMFGSEADLPSPVAHIFYDKRVSDADDAYPKYRGFFPSQFAFLRRLLTAKRSR